jgi:hypothetical protein
MTLIICSNQEKDATAENQKQSVYSAWSFRNPLSSTMTIPANSQVALQSCKINVDGRMVVGNNNNKFYINFGDKLNQDGTTPPQQEDSTSAPVLINLLGDSEKTFLELSPVDMANQIRDVVRNRTFHPNQKNLFTAEVARNASGLDFNGYNLTFKQNKNVENKVPPNGDFENFYSEAITESNVFSYTGGQFKRTLGADLAYFTSATSLNRPLSLVNGSFVVSVNGAKANANASGVEWSVGLARYATIIDPVTGYKEFKPEYFDDTLGDDLGFDTITDNFVDFAIARNSADELVVYQSAFDGVSNKLVTKEVNYWQNASSVFNGLSQRANWATNASGYTKVSFKPTGEDMEIQIYNNGAGTYQTLVTFNSGGNSGTYFKPINQACWCLHPVLQIGTSTTNPLTNLSSTLHIEHFSSPTNVDDTYNPKKVGKSGWFEYMNLVNSTNQCYDLESRTWNQPTIGTRTILKTNASGGVDYKDVMILQQNDIYKPSHTANAGALLGYNQAIVDTPNSGDDTNSVLYTSAVVPSIQASLALFVRLNNFTQTTMNAFTGNNSKIIAHLPRFDNGQDTGRLYFEPNNPVFIDLNNTNPLQINEFDISFNYINEQYAQLLTGQSIVTLLIREKPK